MRELSSELSGGLEVWGEVERNVGKAVAGLLQHAAKDPSMNHSLYPLLEDLQRGLEMGRKLVSESQTRAAAEQSMVSELQEMLDQPTSQGS